MKKRFTLGYPSTLGTGSRSGRPFDQVFDRVIEVGPKEIRAGDVDALVVWGGADISPSIYREPVSNRTGASEELSYRDRIEVAAMAAAISTGVPIIGVCRGAQLACAMSGGKLIQHVNGHHMDHEITTEDKKTLVSSSVHHQMMFPFHVDHELIAWSTKRQSDVYLGGHDTNLMEMFDLPEPEIVFFPKTKALAVQGHPEFMRPDCEFVQYVNNLVSSQLLRN